jgi:hypothetical protein
LCTHPVSVIGIWIILLFILAAFILTNIVEM